MRAAGRCALLLSLVLLAGSAPAAPTITYFRMPGVFAGIKAGPDGNLWVPTSSGIGVVTPAGGMTMHTVPDGVIDLVAGPDGRMWYAVWTKARIGAMTIAGVSTEYPLRVGTVVNELTVGADGAIWFGYYDVPTSSSGVGRITTTGDATYYPVVAPAQVLDLEVGRDGNIWFPEYPQNRIGRITPAGVMTHFETYPATCCSPVSIARGADGELWIAFNQGRQIARVLMNGTLKVVYPVGDGSSYTGRPMTVESGPNALIWFTTESTSQIGRLREDGSVELINFSSGVPGAKGAVAGPDGNLWVTLRAPSYGCTWECPPPDPTPPLAVARVNLVARTRQRSIRR